MTTKVTFCLFGGLTKEGSFGGQTTLGKGQFFHFQPKTNLLTFFTEIMYCDLGAAAPTFFYDYVHGFDGQEF